MAIWVTSDLHLNHKNIVALCRPEFKTLEEHDEYIIKQYNSVVGKDDLSYIIGDAGFTPKDRLISLLSRLNGRKILIRGNHDRLKEADYRKAGIIQVIDHPVYYNNNIILSHIPVQEAFDNPWVLNVHGHLHGSVLDLPNFYNVNVELQKDYLPINIKVLEDLASKITTRYRWQPYGTEWYFKYTLDRKK